jgi:GT2 family glycosyltransferase
MNTTIATVVVTYNRLGLLKECVEALRNQTLKPDAIIIVNNGSNDGTKLWLETQKDLLVFQQDNLGGAGGFHRGMKEAQANGYDWIWIMDDDAFPEATCLEQMVGNAIQNDIKVIAPLVVENGQYSAFHRGWINQENFKFPRIQESVSYEYLMNTDSDLIKVDFISFVGLMLHKSVIAKIGLPEAAYYIFNDDVEYSLRIKKAGISMHLLVPAVIHHKVNDTGRHFNLKKTSFNNEHVSDEVKGFFQKLKNRKHLYYDINLFLCYSRRNSLINIITYFDISKLQVFYLCLMDFIKSFARIGISKGAFSKYRLLFESYRQGANRKIENQIMIELASHIKP